MADIVILHISEIGRHAIPQRYLFPGRRAEGHCRGIEEEGRGEVWAGDCGGGR